MLFTLGTPTWLGRFWVATRSDKITEISFGDPPPLSQVDDPLGRDAAEQLTQFLEGGRRSFDLPLDWSVLPPAHADILRTLYETVGWGQVVAYGELAMLAGYPGAARAAGTACRINPFPMVVPAHRVIAAGGRIGGFGGRTDIKRKLLAREGQGPFRD